MSERDIITISLPRQLLRDFESLPDDVKSRYANFSDYAREKVRQGIIRDLQLVAWDVAELERETHRKDPPK